MKFDLNDNSTIGNGTRQFPSSYPNADYLKMKLKDLCNHHEFVNFETLLDPYCDRIHVDSGYNTDGSERVFIDPEKCPRGKDGHCSECPHLVHHIYVTGWCAKKVEPMVIPV